MEFLGHLARCSLEIATLVRMLITNGLRFMTLCAKSRAALTAENLFLRKQLAFYQKRQVVPHRFDNASRYLLVLLSRWFAWKDALVNVTPKTLSGTVQGFACSGVGNVVVEDHRYRTNFAH